MVKNQAPVKEKTKEELMAMAARKSWLSTDQFAWMTQKIVIFIDKQGMELRKGVANDHVDAYVNVVIGEFDEKWPYILSKMDIPTHGVGGTPEERGRTHFFRFRQWFRNQTKHTTAAGTGRPEELKVETGHKRRSKACWFWYQTQSLEADHRIEYDNLSSEEKSATNWNTWQQSKAAELFRKLDEKEQTAVIARRDEAFDAQRAASPELEDRDLYEWPDSAGEDEVLRRNKAMYKQKKIEVAHKTIHSMHDAIKRETGFFSLTVVGGPEPKRGGKMSVLLFSNGITSGDELRLDAYHTSDKMTNILDPISEFLSECFDKDKMTAVSLSDQDCKAAGLSERNTADISTEHADVFIVNPTPPESIASPEESVDEEESAKPALSSTKNSKGQKGKGKAKSKALAKQKRDDIRFGGLADIVASKPVETTTTSSHYVAPELESQHSQEPVFGNPTEGLGSQSHPLPRSGFVEPSTTTNLPQSARSVSALPPGMTFQNSPQPAHPFGTTAGTFNPPRDNLLPLGPSNLLQSTVPSEPIRSLPSAVAPQPAHTDPLATATIRIGVHNADQHHGDTKSNNGQETVNHERTFIPLPPDYVPSADAAPYLDFSQDEFDELLLSLGGGPFAPFGDGGGSHLEMSDFINLPSDPTSFGELAATSLNLSHPASHNHPTSTNEGDTRQPFQMHKDSTPRQPLKSITNVSNTGDASNVWQNTLGTSGKTSSALQGENLAAFSHSTTTRNINKSSFAAQPVSHDIHNLSKTMSAWPGARAPKSKDTPLAALDKMFSDMHKSHLGLRGTNGSNDMAPTTALSLSLAQMAAPESQSSGISKEPINSPLHDSFKASQDRSLFTPSPTCSSEAESANMSDQNFISPSSTQLSDTAVGNASEQSLFTPPSTQPSNASIVIPQDHVVLFTTADDMIPDDPAFDIKRESRIMSAALLRYSGYELVNLWRQLEHATGFPGSTGGRAKKYMLGYGLGKMKPHLLTVWWQKYVKTSQSPLHSATDAQALLGDLQNFYLLLQPPHRATSVFPLPMTPPPDAQEWEPLLKGGVRGFYILLRALSWLPSYLDGGPDKATLTQLATDMVWVLRSLLAAAPLVYVVTPISVVPAKRRADEASILVEEAPSKRVCRPSARALQYQVSAASLVDKDVDLQSSVRN